MALMFARQPIFDIKNNVYGYELLYREEGKTAYDCANGDVATSNVMAAGFLSMGIGHIVRDKKAFINFTENLLLHQVATLFPNKEIVVEILETVEPRKDIISACRNLKKNGYLIALDDFIFKPGYEALVEIADLIKVDFLLTSSESERKYVTRHFRNGKTKFLAEKVESREDFKMAADFGYSYFQGYFFSKPVIVSSREIPSSMANRIRLIKALASNIPSFEDISGIIEKDVAFSYEILRIANTMQYYRGNGVKSIRQAAVMMGLEELKKWAFITVLRKLSSSGQEETVNFCVQRAKTLEFVCNKLEMKDRKMEYFTLGMLSMIDTLTGCPMNIILPELAISDEISQLLYGNHNEGKMSLCYRLILSYEKGDWDRMTGLSEKLALKTGDIAEAYNKAVAWINNNN